MFAHNNHPLGKQLIDWHPDPAIARTLSLNFNAHAGQFIVAWRPPGGVQEVDGRSCLVGPYFLFDIDDRVAFNTDASVTMELLFDRKTSNGFFISWDHVVKPAAKRIRFRGEDTRRWHREIVTLDRARFANRHYAKTDFSIAAPGATWPHDGADAPVIALCDIKITMQKAPGTKKQAGRLALTLVDNNGRPTAARLGLYDEEGRAPLASDSALPIMRYSEQVKQLSLLDSNTLWRGDGRFVYYMDGKYETDLPAGRYTLVINKGPEYRILQRQFEVLPGQTSNILLQTRRWIDMPAANWYSGDVHIHIGRHEAAVNDSILAFTRAEDIHVANLLQMGNVATSHFPQYGFGRAGQYTAGEYSLVAGQESPRTGHLGHTIGLNGKAFYQPGSQYYLYNLTAERIQADGGLFGYAHVALADVFNLDRGLALDVPAGYVDFMEILQSGTLNTRHFYNFLNLGYRVLPAAGSDYPYIHVAGSERTYVRVAANYSLQAWFDAWRNGRSFVSNGPMIAFTVNGNNDDREFDLERGETVSLAASARVNPELDTLETLELVVQGEVVASGASGRADGLILRHSWTPGTTTWFALRTRGSRGSLAHTAPVYLYVDGNQRFWKRSAVGDIATGYIASLEKLHVSEPDPHEDFELFNTEHAISRAWQESRPALQRRIMETIGVYRRLQEEAAAQEDR